MDVNLRVLPLCLPNKSHVVSSPLCPSLLLTHPKRIIAYKENKEGQEGRSVINKDELLESSVSRKKKGGRQKRSFKEFHLLGNMIGCLNNLTGSLNVQKWEAFLFSWANPLKLLAPPAVKVQGQMERLLNLPRVTQILLLKWRLKMQIRTKIVTRQLLKAIGTVTGNNINVKHIQTWALAGDQPLPEGSVTVFSLTFNLPPFSTIGSATYRPPQEAICFVRTNSRHQRDLKCKFRLAVWDQVILCYEEEHETQTPHGSPDNMSYSDLVQ